MRKVLFFDVDGVLFEWFKPFIKYANQEGIDLKFEHITGYNLELLPCWDTPHQCFKFIGDFSKTDQWAKLPLLSLPSSLQMLHNLGYELRVLSQVSNLEAQVKRAKSITEAYGPVFSGIHFTTHKTKKSEWLHAWLTVNEDAHAWLLDDKPDTIRECGGIVRHREHNGVGSRLHPVAISNDNDHPYLVPHIDVLGHTMPGCFQWFQTADAFAMHCAITHLQEEMDG